MKSAFAQTAAVDCAGLDTVEVERVLGLELAAAAAKASLARKPVVHILCTDATLHIEISEPQSGAQRSLDVPAPSEGEARERTVALAASQLFVGSWLEMVEAAAKAEEARPKPPEPKAPPPPPPSPPPPPAPRRVRYELGVGAHGAFRQPSQPLSFYGVGVHVSRIQDSSWFVGLSARAEQGKAEREQGEVRARILTAEVDAGLRAQFSSWALDAQLQLAALAVQGEGVSTTSTAQGSTVNGSAFDLGLGVGPSFGSGRVRLRLLGAAGYLATRVRLRVADEASVDLGGPWAALSLAGTFGWEP